MGRLIYGVIGSLDGYYVDADGSFDWAEPTEEELAFVSEQERGIGTYLYGRRMYETMHVWETDPQAAAGSPESAVFAELWQAADKVVYSTSLPETWTTRTELRRSFDPAEVRALKEAATADLNVSGPELARHAFAAGLVDEMQCFLVPEIIGRGRSMYPGTRLSLDLREERRFASGMVFLRYAVGRV